MISAVFVSYRTAACAARAVESFRLDASRAGLPAEVVVVVNSDDAGEARALEPLADAVLFPGENLGYAGGLNLGMARASGDVFFLANPDLVFLPGSVAPLAAAAEDTFTIAGPARFWDEGARTLLPPSEEPRPAELARRWLALDAARTPRLFRREVRRALAQRDAVASGRTVEVSGLSGALMVVSRDTLARLGPLDARYRLYYEENDWQKRLRDLGGSLLFVGASRVAHAYAQSTRHEPLADGWFHQSERRYFTEHFGEAGERALARLGTPSPGSPVPEPPEGDTLSWDPGHEALVAVSPVPTFRPFVLVEPGPGASSFHLPGEIAAAHPGTVWYLRAFDPASGATLAEARIGLP